MGGLEETLDVWRDAANAGEPTVSAVGKELAALRYGKTDRKRRDKADGEPDAT